MEELGEVGEGDALTATETELGSTVTTTVATLHKVPRYVYFTNTALRLSEHLLSAPLGAWKCNFLPF